MTYLVWQEAGLNEKNKWKIGYWAPCSQDTPGAVEQNPEVSEENADYPPKFDIAGFDKDILKDVARDKLDELSEEEQSIASRERLEDFAYSILVNTEKYSVLWFNTNVFLYRLEKDRRRLARWRKYWERFTLSDKPKETKPGGFTESELEKARQFPIEDLIGSPWRNAGGGKLAANCPFHEERTPSFIIYTNDNSAHCYGCNAHIKNAIDFVMLTEKLDFKQAVRRLL